MNHPAERDIEREKTMRELEQDREALAKQHNAGRKPKFGDLMRNPWASERNPTRDGYFVKSKRVTGRFNPGLYYEMTDRDGKFWEIDGKVAMFLEEPARAAQATSEPVERGGDVEPNAYDRLREQYESIFKAPLSRVFNRIQTLSGELSDEYKHSGIQHGWRAFQAGHRIGQKEAYAAPDRAPSTDSAAGWISVEDRLPEWSARDDTHCVIDGKIVPPTLTSQTVLVAIAPHHGVRIDKLITIEGSEPWFDTYRGRVTHWQPLPPPPIAAMQKEG